MALIATRAKRRARPAAQPGVRLDRDSPEWIRLYLAKFGNADFDSQVKTYEIIRVNATYAPPNDNRPESIRARHDELVHVELLDTSSNWQPRRMHLDGLIGATTMCELLKQNPKGARGTASPALGLITPTDIETTVLDADPSARTTRPRSTRPERRT